MKQELYLKTMFCCMACDGEIAAEEVDLIRNEVAHEPLLEGLDAEPLLNGYIAAINQQGRLFLRRYLDELAGDELTKEEELRIVDLAVRMVEADGQVVYAEVQFVKKIRKRLSVTDEQILTRFPNREYYLLPDINVMDDPMWNESIMFEDLHIEKGE